MPMKTKDGKKFIRVPEYVRIVNDKPQIVKAHIKSTYNTKK